MCPVATYNRCNHWWKVDSDLFNQLLGFEKRGLHDSPSDKQCVQRAGSEAILDELHKNVEMDMKKLSYYINCLLKQHETSYKQMARCVKFEEIPTVFIETRVNNFGHAMAFDQHDESPWGCDTWSCLFSGCTLENIDLIYYNKN